MIVDLPSTTTTEVSKSLVQLRNNVGAMAMTRVLTLLVVADEQEADGAIRTANDASRQHPARIIVIVHGNRRGRSRLDAQIRVGGDAGASEIVVLRLYGELADHGEAVIMPLLLPDSPIVAWWPQNAPADVASSRIGAMAHRRITDASTAGKALSELKRRAEHYRPGDTDLSWTRITRWRGVLAASLDQPPYEPVQSAVVTAEADHAGADLLAAWLAEALQVPVTRARSGPGTGLVSTRLDRESGPIELTLTDKTLATLESPGQPVRLVTLATPGLPECLAEELRRLDADEVYAAALTSGRDRVARRSTGPEVGARVKAAKRAKRSAQAVSSTSRTRPSERSERDPFRRVLDTPEQLADAVAEAVNEVVTDAVADRGVAHVVLTGGSLGIAVVRSLAALQPDRGVWRSVHLWWGDERFVPVGDADRNEGQADDAGLRDLGVPQHQVHRMPAGVDESELPAAAAAYALELAEAAAAGEPTDVAVPSFDVVILGMGPDAHVASLFPRRAELTVSDRTTVAVTKSPKPPPLRVSMTVPALSAGVRVWFVIAGADKAKAVADARGRTDVKSLPVTWVRGRTETLWWLDRAAAGEG